jgi:uncharacterized protein
MRCPTCRKETRAEGNPYRPFCSERCKMIDLDNWFSGRYRISTPLGNQGGPADERASPDDAEAEID